MEQPTVSNQLNKTCWMKSDQQFRKKVLRWEKRLVGWKRKKRPTLKEVLR